MTLRLEWQQIGSDHFLFVGEGSLSLASVCKRKKWYDAWVNLPHVFLAKRYAPLDEQKAAVETAVREWFAEALNAAPQTAQFTSYYVIPQREKPNKINSRKPRMTR